MPLVSFASLLPEAAMKMGQKARKTEKWMVKGNIYTHRGIKRYL